MFFSSLTTDGLSIDSIVDIREYCVLVFYIPEPSFVNTISFDIVVQPGEAEHVVPGPFDRVFDVAAGLEDEGPVRALRKEQFPRRLVERAPKQPLGMGEGAGQFDHAVRRLVQMPVNPVVRAVEPY